MTTIKKLFTPVTFAVALLVILVFGIIFNIHVQKQNDFRKLVSAFPTAKKFVVVEDFEETEIDIEGNIVKIVSVIDAFEGSEKVGAIYVGETEGYGGPLQLGYGIRFEDHKVVGMGIILSNETPNYLSALLGHEDFLPQFKEKDMSSDNFGVDTVVGATPGGGTNKVVTPVTTSAMNNILLAVRIQYANDSNGEFKVPESVKLIKKRQDYDNLSQFIYELEFEKQEITVTVNDKYEILSVSKDEFATIEMKAKISAFINKNKLTTLITNIEVNSETNITTLTITSNGYAITITSVIELDSEGKITNLTADTEGETYDLGRWKEENGHPHEVLPGRIIENQSAEVDGIVRATVTSNAIKSAASVAFDYAKEVIK